MEKLIKAIETLEEQIEALVEDSQTSVDIDESQLTDLSANLATLKRARHILARSSKSKNSFITYKIASDIDGKLWAGAKTACNFWNRFISPRTPVVIRLGTFHSSSNTIARAYYAYSNNGVEYGRVEFNIPFLKDYSHLEIAGTIVHEIGHTLGIGWDVWNKMYSRKNGKFYADAIEQIPALKKMTVELEGLAGTIYSHWDEAEFGSELMTGYKNDSEYVLPVTIDVMEIFGHEVIEKLKRKSNLDTLLKNAEQMVFSRTSEAETIDRDYFEETPIFEELPH